MSWLRTAFTICTPDEKAYYTVIDPIEFYEWRFTNVAEKGHFFTRKLPPSDIFTEGQVIASANITESSLKPERGGYTLSENSPVDVTLKIGHMPNPQELIDRYHDAVKRRDKGIEAFKQDLSTRIYISSQDDNPHLFRLSHYTDENVTMHNFGLITDLTEQFAVVRQSLVNESLNKKGRAHEMEEFRRFENAMTFINNSHLYVDSSKLDRLIETAKIKAMQTKTLPWMECYLDISPEAQSLDNRIKHFEEQTWVKSVLGINEGISL